MASAVKVFTRQSTGLTREAGTWSTLIYNINFISIGLMMLFVLQLEPALYPGASMQISYVLALLLVLPTSLVFAFLASAMPRSGGDYVYVSRILGPRLGMMSSWINTVWWFIYGGVPSAFFARYGLGPLFRNVGLLSGNTALVDLGSWFVTPEGTIITGVILIAALVGVFSLGLRVYFRIQNILFVLAVLALGLVALVLLTGSPAQFQANLDSYFGSGAYANTIANAQGGGFAEAPVDVAASLIPITWIYLELVFNQSSAYIGGEVKQSSRLQLWSMPIAAIASVAAAMLITGLFESQVGTSFLGAVSYDFGADLGLSSAPTYTEIAAYMSGSTIVAIFAGVGFLFWSYTWLPGQILNASRNLLAYGLDGVMPEWVSRVSDRFHTPINALACVGVGSVVFLVIYVNNSFFNTLVGIPAFVVSFILVSIAAILFPTRRREVFEASPVNWRLGGIPVISIVGAVSLAACLVVEWAYFNDPWSGVNILSGFSLTAMNDDAGAMTTNWRNFLVAAGTVVSGLVVYEIARVYRARQGIRLERTFDEIPVE
jgi:APA family basic amino acid/polyamine antiporter